MTKTMCTEFKPGRRLLGCLRNKQDLLKTGRLLWQFNQANEEFRR
jgi:hypothetical protein